MDNPSITAYTDNPTVIELGREGVECPIAVVGLRESSLPVKDGGVKGGNEGDGLNEPGVRRKEPSSNSTPDSRTILLSGSGKERTIGGEGWELLRPENYFVRARTPCRIGNQVSHPSFLLPTAPTIYSLPLIEPKATIMGGFAELD